MTSSSLPHTITWTTLLPDSDSALAASLQDDYIPRPLPIAPPPRKASLPNFAYINNNNNNNNNNELATHQILINHHLQNMRRNNTIHNVSPLGRSDFTVVTSSSSSDVTALSQVAIEDKSQCSFNSSQHTGSSMMSVIEKYCPPMHTTPIIKSNNIDNNDTDNNNKNINNIKASSGVSVLQSARNYHARKSLVLSPQQYSSSSSASSSSSSIAAATQPKNDTYWSRAASLDRSFPPSTQEPQPQQPPQLTRQATAPSSSTSHSGGKLFEHIKLYTLDRWRRNFSGKESDWLEENSSVNSGSSPTTTTIHIPPRTSSDSQYQSRQSSLSFSDKPPTLVDAHLVATPRSGQSPSSYKSPLPIESQVIVVATLPTQSPYQNQMMSPLPLTPPRPSTSSSLASSLFATSTSDINQSPINTNKPLPVPPPPHALEGGGSQQQQVSMQKWRDMVESALTSKLTRKSSQSSIKSRTGSVKSTRSNKSLKGTLFTGWTTSNKNQKANNNGGGDPAMRDSLNIFRASSFPIDHSSSNNKVSPSSASTPRSAGAAAARDYTLPKASPISPLLSNNNSNISYIGFMPDTAGGVGVPPSVTSTQPTATPAAAAAPATLATRDGEPAKPTTNYLSFDPFQTTAINNTTSSSSSSSSTNSLSFSFSAGIPSPSAPSANNDDEYYALSLSPSYQRPMILPRKSSLDWTRAQKTV